jgi:predicted transcriptional regulator with HTH domain
MGEREENNKKEVKKEIRSVRTKTLKKRTMWYLYDHYPCSYIQYLTHLTN